jgi:hypothetical protein
MSEWKECKLGDVGVVVTGKTPSSKNPWVTLTIFLGPAWFLIRTLPSPAFTQVPELPAASLTSDY